jgi:hypothetical protein
MISQTCLLPVLQPANRNRDSDCLHYLKFDNSK